MRYIVVNTECIGFVVLKPQGSELLIEHLYVKPGAQCQGVGTAVLAQLFSEANRMSLPVQVGALRESASNRYARHGFQLVESGKFDNYYVRPVHHAS